jgi:hypothetical protein
MWLVDQQHSNGAENKIQILKHYKNWIFIGHKKQKSKIDESSDK